MTVVTVVTVVKVVTVMTVMTVMTVVTVATVATVVTVVTVVNKQLCTPKNLNLHKTYLPTYLCDSSYSSDSSDSSDSSHRSDSSESSDSSDGSDSSNQKKTFFTKKLFSQKKFAIFFFFNFYLVIVLPCQYIWKEQFDTMFIQIVSLLSVINPKSSSYFYSLFHLYPLYPGRIFLIICLILNYRFLSLKPL